MPGKGRVPWLQGVLAANTAGGGTLFCGQALAAANSAEPVIKKSHESFICLDFPESYNQPASWKNILHLPAKYLDEKLPINKKSPRAHTWRLYIFLKDLYF
jgi:hypothetical protein